MSAKDDPPPFRNVGKKAAPAAARARLKALFGPHVDSFDYFVEEGLARCVAGLEAQEVEHPNGGPRLRFWLESAKINRPLSTGHGDLDAKALLPSECRERALSYRGQVRAILVTQLGDEPPERHDRRFGLMPVMLS